MVNNIILFQTDPLKQQLRQPSPNLTSHELPKRKTRRLQQS